MPAQHVCSQSVATHRLSPYATVPVVLPFSATSLTVIQTTAHLNNRYHILKFTVAAGQMMYMTAATSELQQLHCACAALSYLLLHFILDQPNIYFATGLSLASEQVPV